MITSAAAIRRSKEMDPVNRKARSLLLPPPPPLLLQRHCNATATPLKRH
jgi:hypothetical protein